MKKLLLIYSLVFFSGIGSSDLYSQTVYVTKTGEKYHLERCHYLKSSKIQLEYDKAKEMGFTPCKVCKPGINVIKSNNIRTQNTSKTSAKPSIAVRCSGKTKSGNRCKRKTKNASGRCYQH